MPSPATIQKPAPTACGEFPFWIRTGARWQHLAGGLHHHGFSFEWHELEPSQPVNWGQSFHPNSAEICLNLEGNAWVKGDGKRMEFKPGTKGFFITSSKPLDAVRPPERHRFLSIEFSLSFLKNRLGDSIDQLHPAMRGGLNSHRTPPLSEVTRLNRRHHELLTALLNPPVLAPARHLWYESKALEVASEFFFANPEPAGSRPARLSAERIAKAKAILARDLCNPPTLEDLGRAVGCSQFYLSRTFTRETGLTISQWLRQARLEKAADLLKSGCCNVTEAAFAVGYSSLSHFSLAFHEQYGCCPGLYPVRTTSQNAASSRLQ